MSKTGRRTAKILVYIWNAGNRAACRIEWYRTIRDIAACVDLHRKELQAQYPKLTLTGMYNVLEQLRDGDELSVKDMVIRKQGDVDTLLALHEDLDAAVAEAYG